MPPNAPYQPAPPPVQPHEYEFITNPGQPPRRSFRLLPEGSSLLAKIAIIGGGLLVLLIVFMIIKGIVGGGGNADALIGVAQEQQQIVHLAANALEQDGLSVSNQNFAVTAQASLTSGQAQVVTYLANNGHKVKTKQLNLKVSTALDQQLTTAASNSTYNSTFQQIMQDQLKDYQQTLQTAYQQTTGPKGRKLLSEQFNGSKLLLQQLTEPAS